MLCPNCRLTNPPNALRCDCGYDFFTQSLKQPYSAAVPKRTFAREFAQSCGIGILLMIPLIGIFLAFGGIHSSDPNAQLIMNVFLPGAWVAMKVFPHETDLPITLVTWALDILLFGAFVMICRRVAVSLNRGRNTSRVK